MIFAKGKNHILYNQDSGFKRVVFLKMVNLSSVFPVLRLVYMVPTCCFLSTLSPVDTETVLSPK